MIVPLDSKQHATNYLIMEINGNYYSATADEEAMKKIRALERNNEMICQSGERELESKGVVTWNFS
ncbi:hypothetical protein ACWKW1_16070 [Brevibacillus parabrevis]